MCVCRVASHSTCAPCDDETTFSRCRRRCRCHSGRVWAAQCRSAPRPRASRRGAPRGQPHRTCHLPPAACVRRTSPLHRDLAAILTPRACKQPRLFMTCARRILQGTRSRRPISRGTFPAARVASPRSHQRGHLERAQADGRAGSAEAESEQARVSHQQRVPLARITTAPVSLDSAATRLMSLRKPEGSIRYCNLNCLEIGPTLYAARR